MSSPMHRSRARRDSAAPPLSRSRALLAGVVSGAALLLVGAAGATAAVDRDGGSRPATAPDVGKGWSSSVQDVRPGRSAESRADEQRVPRGRKVPHQPGFQPAFEQDLRRSPVAPEGSR